MEIKVPVNYRLSNILKDIFLWAHAIKYLRKPTRGLLTTNNFLLAKLCHKVNKKGTGELVRTEKNGVQACYSHIHRPDSVSQLLSGTLRQHFPYQLCHIARSMDMYNLLLVMYSLCKQLLISQNVR